MAHFFKYANRVMHTGTPEAKQREEREEKMRKARSKAQEGISHSELISDAKAIFLKKREEEKRLRSMFKKNKGSAIQNALNKHK